MIFNETTPKAHEHSDPFTRKLWSIIRVSVKALAILMTLVIILGIFDVVWMLYQRLITPPVFLLSINDILATFGAFMAVLIAIEIFANIVVYLDTQIIHLKLVISTALMAAARKVIVLDFSVNDHMQVISLGVVILALSIGYWLTCMKGKC
ncbi:phosphate-starvation-inducible PsiE family protein [Desulfovibrio ferrophilus]|uniref:Membrane protein-like protein n=1 Tax=Desulfovibrio ferrophilus TaxID=241368 RepID=A0A2Z6AYM5_9BACT|nr:phosphate-starvation-inducible PsiE family protein [Desulfovibrio ferrophilus]BBD08300.1 membrane protein-like protein [Desulfovibrio ferrophilus]